MSAAGMKARLLVLLCALLVLLFFVRQAMAVGYTHPTLNAAASEVAGRPMNVWCEWHHEAWVRSLPAGYGDASGFFQASQPDWVYIGPSQCRTLLNYLSLRKVDEVGVFNFTSALFTLAHEAIHARLFWQGGDYANEGLTDCTAMPLVPGIATRHFGISETVTSVVYRPTKKKVSIKVRVKGKLRTFTRTVTTYVPVFVTLTNPELARLTSWLIPIHRMKPPEYQGTC